MIGIDLVHIPRVQMILEGEFGNGFADRVFTEKEMRSFAAILPSGKAERMAIIFALKEATIKASLGRLTMADIHRIEIVHRGERNPLIEVKENNITGQFIGSVSRAGDYVIGIAAWKNGSAEPHGM